MGKGILMVGLGGAAGSILRYLTYLLLNRFFITVFPVATFTVNVLGSFIIGWLIAYFEKQSTPDANLKLMLITGFCGGFTTFSTFASDNSNLLQSGHVVTAMLYSVFSFFTCVCAVWLAMYLVK